MINFVQNLGPCFNFQDSFYKTIEFINNQIKRWPCVLNRHSWSLCRVCGHYECKVNDLNFYSIINMEGILPRMLLTYGTNLSCLFPSKMSNGTETGKNSKLTSIKFSGSVVCMSMFSFRTDLCYIKFSLSKNNTSCCCLVCNHLWPNNSMKQRPPLKANSSSVNADILRILCNYKFHYRVNNSLPLIHILSNIPSFVICLRFILLLFSI